MQLSRPRRSGRVSESIAKRIKKQISDGALLPGEKLPAERDMAQRYRTSRVSVREAYRSLEERGLLTIRRSFDLVAPGLKQFGQALPLVNFVVHHQNLRTCAHPGDFPFRRTLTGPFYHLFPGGIV